MTQTIDLYFFKLRSDTKPGKWHKTRWRMTLEEAKARHGEGNFEVLWETKEVRERTDPQSLRAGNVGRER